MRRGARKLLCVRGSAVAENDGACSDKLIGTRGGPLVPNGTFGRVSRLTLRDDVGLS